MTFVPVTRKEDVTVFNELLAAGEEPDILFSYDYPTMISYYSRGAFQPIDEDVLKTYAPTFYEKTKDLEEYTKVDDQRYFLAATRPLAYNWVTLIRTDWLEKAGLSMPTNQEEYVNALKKFKELKLGGENTILQRRAFTTHISRTMNTENIRFRKKITRCIRILPLHRLHMTQQSRS